MVPAFVSSIKGAGLVLVIDTSEDPPAQTASLAASTSAQSATSLRSYQMPDGVDGILKREGVLRFSGALDM